MAGLRPAQCGFARLLTAMGLAPQRLPTPSLPRRLPFGLGYELISASPGTLCLRLCVPQVPAKRILGPYYLALQPDKVTIELACPLAG